MRVTRRIFWLPIGLIAASALGSAPAPAQGPAASWPQRSVRVITPLGPGSGMDIVTRVFSERLAARWRQSVVVENRQGADGINAVNALLGDRDNHTLLFSFAGLISINPLIHDKLPYDPARDLVPIVSAVDSTLAIAVPGSLDVGTLAEFIALARAEPRRLNWAATAGLPIYVLGALQKNANIELVQVSYRDFTPAFQDLAEGRIQLMSTGINLLLAQTRAGKAKLLLVTNRERSPLAPEVPTAREAGYPDLTFDAVNGFYGARDMTADIKEKIAADVRAIAADPAVGQRLAATGAVIRSGTTADFLAAIEEQRAKVAAIHQAMGGKPAR
jgi:tripartite-type tricarboxylate transporter receptor subunit TctC